LKFAQHLYLNRISNDHAAMYRYSKTRELEEMGNWRRDKKIKNAQKNVHCCTLFCASGFYPNVSYTTVQDLFALIKIFIMQLSYCRYDQI